MKLSLETKGWKSISPKVPDRVAGGLPMGPAANFSTLAGWRHAASEMLSDRSKP
jgi:hypothetical protein